ncbi:phosphate regulon transcriptional regulator PhoB [Bartonella sp. HY329]|uniref:phosphate regulon transcriptional regulator PhoB n=1 Tax=unclassified Bartonella TaxID=2645622 RepID=UPI0021C6E045|nr:MULTISPECIES: phosphate regulon transcriptional regulator PhoB [unclassified Bartonella]UXM95519.1 phosphate regulon transcriptional regulator PhoB [Bartonella sp. HY329]UXN09844.1 phosphate regulon transcriptional regulator PhoB [Bartonella sp. HY328]
MARVPEVAVVEDEDALTILLRYNLEAEGYKVRVIMRGDDAEFELEENRPDLVLLDWMLPGLSGIELCRRLRQRDSTAHLPIIMLTARGEENERIRGLSVGADDYVTKPFSIPELMARVKALLRRVNPSTLAHVLSNNDLTLDRQQHRVFYKDVEVKLGPTEFRLLEFFMMAPGRVFTRTQLLDAVWGNDNFVDDRTVDVHIRRLRKAINIGEKDLIRTVRGTGYSFG